MRGPLASTASLRLPGPESLRHDVAALLASVVGQLPLIRFAVKLRADGGALGQVTKGPAAAVGATDEQDVARRRRRQQIDPQPAGPHAVTLGVGNREVNAPFGLAPREDGRYAIGIQVEDQFGRTGRWFLFQAQIVVNAYAQPVLRDDAGRLGPDNVQDGSTSGRKA